MRHLLVFALCGWLVLPVWAATDKIVLVDGLTATMTGRCTFQTCTDRPSYLWNDLGSLLQTEMNNRGANADIHAFRWSGDMIKHGEKLKQKFHHWFFSQVCSAAEICHVSFIAHSWGSVIATDFLASQEENPVIKVRTMVTLGSPVTGAKARLENAPLIRVTPFWIKAIEKVRGPANWIDGRPARWVNLVNPRDPIGWDYLDENNLPIAGVENLRADGSASTKGRLHHAYPINESELDPLFLPAVLTPESQGIDFLKIIVDGWRGQSGTLDMARHGIPAYEPQRLVRYVTERLPVVAQAPEEPNPPEALPTIGSTFHGAGSLIEPQSNCYGCNRDIAVMQPAATASTVVFQSKNANGRCPYLELQADLDGVHIVTKAWSDTEARYTYLAHALPVSLPVPNLWNTTAVTSLQPLNRATRVYAYCRARDTNAGAKTRTSDVAVTFADGHTWAGNGSIISRDSVGNDFGNLKDVAMTHTDKASLTAFQWQVSPRCPRLKIHAYPGFSGTLKVKPWDAASYAFEQVVDFPYTFSRPHGYWVIALETAPGAVSFGKIYAACED